jgi:hypothetical protein
MEFTRPQGPQCPPPRGAGEIHGLKQGGVTINITIYPSKSTLIIDKKKPNYRRKMIKLSQAVVTICNCSF